jgi:hypothetical protein
VALGDVREPREAETPSTNEESECQTQHSAGRNVLRAEQEEPIATIRRRQEVVLQQDREEEPHGDLALHDRSQQRGDLVGHLAVIRWQADVQRDSDAPEEQRNNKRDREQHGERGQAVIRTARCRCS